MSGATDTRAIVVAEILAHIADGHTLRGVFRGEATDGVVPPHWPDRVTFWRWTLADKAIRGAYDTAIDARADVYAEEVVDVVDNPESSPIFDDAGRPICRADGTPVLVIDKVAVDHARLRCDARKWVASRLLRKRYGDSLTHVGDPDNPVAVTDPRSALLRSTIPDAPAPGTSEPDRRAND